MNRAISTSQRQVSIPDTGDLGGSHKDAAIAKLLVNVGRRRFHECLLDLARSISPYLRTQWQDVMSCDHESLADTSRLTGTADHFRDLGT